ncbi:hypothetical protein [Ruminococcus sp.]|mgnify:CR=1 FL=1|jgi:hypothetical protein|uniref:hypothetical protein n=1 Tax=Ruminococcus sp. TaxID=41978 RepID=UPI00206023C6|nr:MAG TPA: hypothetical protein [Caudoviricetes sp.]
MDIQHYKLNLDLLKNTSTPILYSHQLDKKSRFIDVTLTANDAEVTLDRTMTAVLNAVTNNVIVASAQSCTISDNVIVVELTDKVLSLPGVTKCEVVLSDSSGAVITAQHFIIKITEKAINDKSKFEPTGSNLATEAAVAKAKAEAIEYFETELTDLDETVTMKINLKADKADTLAGYRITDAYDKTYINRSLNNKLNKMPFDTAPKENSPNYITSGTLYNSVNALNQTIATKYDKSNIESGTGELSPATPSYEGCAGRFDYVKNGKVVTVSVNITKLIADKAYIQMSGLPFPAKIESKLSGLAVYSTTNKLRNIRVDGSWLYISSPTDKFTEDEKINFTITYIRQ